MSGWTLVFVAQLVHAMHLIVLNEVAATSVELPLGALCKFTSQCAADSYCGEGRCRKSSCRQNHECSQGELCQYGKVEDSFRFACFAFRIGPNARDDFCPGGGRPVANAGGFVETCDLNMPCLGNSVCNPIYGICCSKLRACPYPKQPVLESDTHRPIMCQLRGNRQLECPPESQCEKSTGFCCTSQPVSSQTPKAPETKVSLPRAGDRCEEGEECQENAICECEHGVCHCRCLRTMGYILDEENRICKRTRRRLKERCKFDMDCQSAFSECTSGGCRCKEGFERDGKGGCKPTSYKCVNHAEPLKIDDKVVTCVAQRELTNRETGNIELMNDLMLLEDVKSEGGTGVQVRREDRKCPAHYYCVAVFDIPKQASMYQGFCCPTPEPEKPVCPVGNPHSSSQAPHYGCNECPWNYYCHVDTVSKTKKICCPKACLSPEDVYVNGGCYPIAYNGDSCFTSEQCVGKLPGAVVKPETFEFETTELECIKGICECPSGFLFINNGCRKIQCTVGLKSAPSLDTLGNVLQCRNTFDCDQGQVCDPTIRVCCKGTNHCPKKYFETGRPCDIDKCDYNEICVRSRKGKKRVCCKLEV